MIVRPHDELKGLLHASHYDKWLAITILENGTGFSLHIGRFMQTAGENTVPV